MRLWSLHPKYLDAAGLVALWREGLLAKKVLEGKTKGYKAHPQLERFRAAKDPARAVTEYLAAVADEADARGYRFDRSKLGGASAPKRPFAAVADGQARSDWSWFSAKSAKRSPAWRAEKLSGLPEGFLPDPHPSFRWEKGPVAVWEKR